MAAFFDSAAPSHERKIAVRVRFAFPPSHQGVMFPWTRWLSNVERVYGGRVERYVACTLRFSGEPDPNVSRRW